jgi:hypothetical protein
MKRSDLKELIKKSMVEVAPKKDSGAMTPEEEKMVADYEEEKANKYALDKEEPLEEILNIPDDIEWEWDGQVLDQVDSYSAEIGLEGYSPSTGHSFTASVPAYDNGGDWEWNEGDIDFIEQAPMEEDILREADDIVAAYAEKKTLKEVTGPMDRTLNMRDAIDVGKVDPTSQSLLGTIAKMSDSYLALANHIKKAYPAALSDPKVAMYMNGVAEEIKNLKRLKQTLKEADLSQANFSDLNQVVRNIAHVNEVRIEEAAMQAIEYIAEQFDVPVDFKDFN